MTNNPSCTYPADRDEAILDHLYGEADGPSGRLFAAHIEDCRVCREEIAALGGVRLALTRWAPPEPIRAFETTMPTVESRLTPPPRSVWVGLRTMPAWAQAAAAVLCVGVAAGVANLHVTYGDQGMSVSTGWLRTEGTAAPLRAAEEPGAWRAEIEALEDRLRGEFRTMPVAVPTVNATPQEDDSEALLRRMRALITQSEQRQQRELALRIGDVLNDVQAQRRADLSKIDRTIGLIQNNTGMEVMRQREMLNSLAVRVSGQR